MIPNIYRPEWWPVETLRAMQAGTWIDYEGRCKVCKHDFVGRVQLQGKCSDGHEERNRERTVDVQPWVEVTILPAQLTNSREKPGIDDQDVLQPLGSERGSIYYIGHRTRLLSLVLIWIGPLTWSKIALLEHPHENLKPWANQTYRRVQCSHESCLIFLCNVGY